MMETARGESQITSLHGNLGGYRSEITVTGALVTDAIERCTSSGWVTNPEILVKCGPH